MIEIKIYDYFKDSLLNSNPINACKDTLNKFNIDIYELLNILNGEYELQDLLE